jgi:hypothetical protein
MSTPTLGLDVAAPDDGSLIPVSMRLMPAAEKSEKLSTPFGCLIGATSDAFDSYAGDKRESFFGVDFKPMQFVSIAGRSDHRELEIFKLGGKGIAAAYLSVRRTSRNGALHLGFSSEGSFNRVRVEAGQWIRIPPNVPFAAEGIDVDIVDPAMRSFERYSESLDESGDSLGRIQVANLISLMCLFVDGGCGEAVKIPLFGRGVSAERVVFPVRGATTVIETGAKSAAHAAVTSGEVLFIENGRGPARSVRPFNSCVLRAGRRFVAQSLGRATMLVAKPW